MTQTSNAVAVKTAIVAALQDLTGPGGPIAGVSVMYGPKRDMPREAIYLAGIEVDGGIASGRDSEGNVTREETATLTVVVDVDGRGSTLEEAETRALEIGAEIEVYLAVHTPDVPGLIEAHVAGYTLNSYPDDESARAQAVYRIQTSSHIS